MLSTTTGKPIKGKIIKKKKVSMKKSTNKQWHPDVVDKVAGPITQDVMLKAYKALEKLKPKLPKNWGKINIDGKKVKF